VEKVKEERLKATCISSLNRSSIKRNAHNFLKMHVWEFVLLLGFLLLHQAGCLAYKSFLYLCGIAVFFLYFKIVVSKEALK